MRRHPLVLSMVTLLLIALAASSGGCGKTQNSQTQQATAGTAKFDLAIAAKPYRGRTIRLVGEEQPPIEAIRKMSADFTAITGIKVDVDAAGYDVAAQRAALDITSGTGRYDIILQAPEGWGRFAARGQLFPIETFLKNSALHDPSFDPAAQLFDKPARDLGWYQGVAYGYPMTANTMDLWYRRDLFEKPDEMAKFKKRYGYELRAPATWKAYRDVAEFFTRPKKGLYGTLLQAKRHPSLWQEWLNFAFSFGGGTLKKQDAWEYGNIVVNSPESKEATRYYKGLLPFCPPGTLEYTWDDALAAMQQGKVVMALMWTDMSSSIEDTTSSRVVGRVGFAPPPAGRDGVVSQISGYAALVPKSSHSPEAAFLFMQWLLSPENQIRYELMGGQSAYRSVYADSTVRAKVPYAEAVAQTLEHGISMRESFPESQALGERVQTRLSEIMTGQTTVDDGLNALAMDLDKLLGGKAKLAYPVMNAGGK